MMCNDKTVENMSCTMLNCDNNTAGNTGDSTRPVLPAAGWGASAYQLMRGGGGKARAFECRVRRLGIGGVGCVVSR